MVSQMFLTTSFPQKKVKILNSVAVQILQA